MGVKESLKFPWAEACAMLLADGESLRMRREVWEETLGCLSASGKAWSLKEVFLGEGKEGDSGEGAPWKD